MMGAREATVPEDPSLMMEDISGSQPREPSNKASREATKEEGEEPETVMAEEVIIT